MQAFNNLDVPRYALELVHCGVSSHNGASIANALMLDLQESGCLKDNIDLDSLILDKNKITRHEIKVKNRIRDITVSKIQTFYALVLTENLTILGFS